VLCARRAASVCSATSCAPSRLFHFQRANASSPAAAACANLWPSFPVVAVRHRTPYPLSRGARIVPVWRRAELALSLSKGRSALTTHRAGQVSGRASVRPRTYFALPPDRLDVAGDCCSSVDTLAAVARFPQFALCVRARSRLWANPARPRTPMPTARPPSFRLIPGQARRAIPALQVYTERSTAPSRWPLLR
jgi:hypothetical protein